MAQVIISVSDEVAREIEDWMVSHLTLTIRTTGGSKIWIADRVHIIMDNDIIENGQDDERSG